MCLRSSDKGASKRLVLSVYLAAILASSSKSCRQAIAQTRRGDISKKWGETSILRNTEMAHSRSYLAAVLRQPEDHAESR